MNEVLLRVITAQIAQGATDEAVRQISSGTVSGDWIVWTFPCMESKLKDVVVDYEEDSVYVRNNANQTDYEILRSENDFGEV